VKDSKNVLFGIHISVKALSFPQILSKLFFAVSLSYLLHGFRNKLVIISQKPKTNHNTKALRLGKWGSFRGVGKGVVGAEHEHLTVGKRW